MTFKKFVCGMAIAVCLGSTGTLAEQAQIKQEEPMEILILGNLIEKPSTGQRPESVFPSAPVTDADNKAPDTLLPAPLNEPTPVASSAPKAIRKAKPAKIVTGLPSRKATRRLMLSREALAYRGMPYRWGGTSVQTGMDCSGFTQYLYQKQGICLPHNARSQFGMGKAVEVFDLKPGDLVFFNTSGPISHVGMYIGDGKFIHASNPKRGVKVDSLFSAYYKPRYAGARRYTS